MALDIGALQFGWLDIGALESVGITSLSDSVASDLFNFADAIEVNLLNLPALTFAFSDDLQSNWQDAVVTGFPHSSLSVADNFTLADSKALELTVCALEFADALTLLDDVALNGELHLTFLDIGNSFYDEVNATTIAYQKPDEETITDSFELKDSIEYLFEAEANLGELGDTLNLSDEIAFLQTLDITFSDDLNNLNDEVVFMPGEFVELSYDTMMYDWGDAIEVDCKQHRSNVDSMSMSDAVSVLLAGFLQEKTVSDSLNNWGDAVGIVRLSTRALSDNLAFHDEIKLSCTMAKVIVDTLLMSDAIEVKMTSSGVGTFDDSLDLWNDLVAAELSLKLERSVADGGSSTLADDINSEIELGEDTNYYRRYLNDVV